MRMKNELMRRMVALDAKAFGDSATGTLEGYASVKGSLDSYGDTIANGAYKDLDVLVKDGFVTVGHELGDAPVGYILEAREDERGLWVKMAFHGTDEAQSIRKVCKERMDAGKSVGLSIDFYALEWEYKAEEGSSDTIRVLKSIQVVGFAIVNLPAEKLATATAAKSGSGRPMLEQFESLLAELEDWKGRIEWIAANRKQGLSGVNRERITQIKSALDALLEVSEPEEDDGAMIGFAIECEAFLTTIA